MPTPLQATATPTSTATLNVPTIIPTNTIQSTPVPWHFVVSITGDESDPLRSTTGIALDAQNNVYVIDAPAERVQKFDSQGNFVLKWGSPGEGEGQFDFNGWASLTVDHEGNLYTTEQGNHRVQKFDANGNFLQTFGSLGSDDGRFLRPFGITVDPQGYIYVGDMGGAIYRNSIARDVLWPYGQAQLKASVFPAHATWRVIKKVTFMLPTPER